MVSVKSAKLSLLTRRGDANAISAKLRGTVDLMECGRNRQSLH